MWLVVAAVIVSLAGAGCLLRYLEELKDYEEPYDPRWMSREKYEQSRSRK